jgi:uncharacterized membrane protein YedE/YeeE
VPLPSHTISVASAATVRAVPVKRAVKTATHRAHVEATSSKGLTDRIARWFQSLPYSGSYLTLTIIAAFGLGLLSVLANGCPFRQHVMAAQGISGAAYYLVGFYGGILVYDRFVVHWLFRLL